MGKNSAIEWTDHTWNPWVGCFKVSPGCKNCYMYREQKRYGNDPKEIRVTQPGTFSAPLKWAEKDPGLVFTSSWTDFFLAEVDQDTRNRAWNIIQRTPQNTYQVLRFGHCYSLQQHKKRNPRLELLCKSYLEHW